MTNSTYGRAFGANLSKGRSALYGASLMLAVSFIAGCSSLPPNLTTDSRLQIERVNSNNATIGQVSVSADTDSVRVSGSLRKRFVTRGRIPGHLHIELISADGSILNASVTDYHRRFTKSGRAYFSQTIAISPNTVRAIRLVHHGLANQDS